MNPDVQGGYKNVLIHLEHDTGYYGSYFYILELRGDGTLEIRLLKKPGSDDPSVPDEIFNGKIPEADVFKIIGKAEEFDFFNMKPEYHNRNILDGWSTTTEIHFGPKNKKVFNYAGSNRKLAYLDDYIDRICKTAEWIESLSGPDEFS